VEALADIDKVLSEAFAYIERTRRVHEEQKLIAFARRNSDDGGDVEEIKLLRELSERRRKADLHRI
jgi:hypothetical protein